MASMMRVEEGAQKNLARSVSLAEAGVEQLKMAEWHAHDSREFFERSYLVEGVVELAHVPVLVEVPVLFVL